MQSLLDDLFPCPLTSSSGLFSSWDVGCHSLSIYNENQLDSGQVFWHSLFDLISLPVQYSSPDCLKRLNQQLTQDRIKQQHSPSFCAMIVKLNASLCTLPPQLLLLSFITKRIHQFTFHPSIMIHWSMMMRWEKEHCRSTYNNRRIVVNLNHPVHMWGLHYKNLPWWVLQRMCNG